MQSKTKGDIKHSLFNQPFHAYIEAHTTFMLIYRIFLSLISNLRPCFEFKRFSVSPVGDFTYGLIPVQRCAPIFQMPIA